MPHNLLAIGMPQVPNTWPIAQPLSFVCISLFQQQDTYNNHESSQPTVIQSSYLTSDIMPTINATSYIFLRQCIHRLGIAHRVFHSCNLLILTVV
jgi:hypothetical protein